MSGAVIVGPASIGREATIESGAFVSRSAVWRRSIIGEDAIADQCIVADDAVIAPGTHTSQGVVLAGRTEMDWVAQQLVHAAERSTAGRRRQAPASRVRRELVAHAGCRMRIWPVLLDSQPAYLSGRGRNASLLLLPLGAQTLIEHLRDQLEPLTAAPLLVITQASPIPNTAAGSARSVRRRTC